MLLLDQSAPALARPSDLLLAGSLTAASLSDGRGDLFDGLRREMRAFRVGIACYQLRTPLLATFYPHLDGEVGQLTVTPSWLPIVGCGATLDDAWEDWASRFHVRFQTLLARRPWERDAVERGEW